METLQQDDRKTLAQMRYDAMDRPSAWKGLERKYWGVVMDALKGKPVQHIAEIGVDYGYSLFTMALDFPEAKVLGVDPYGHTDEPGCVESGHSDAETWVRKHLPLFPNIDLWTLGGLEAAKLIAHKFDIIHIDAWHDRDFTVSLFKVWEPLLRPGGVMMFHDVNEPEFPGMRQFFAHDLPDPKFLIPDHHGLGFWFKPE